LRKGECNLVDAISSAFFLDTDQLEIDRWPPLEPDSV
jgi:hypothetical protein